ncbi:hypothetical protein BDZ97DRAFT_1913525 [Flammula alnicola]|nr:hypothetical protein BDZ97DRAFT_1913525 [Flammula alnicola]
MPSFSTVVEDTSPILEYGGSWRAGTSLDDQSADQYTQSSFTLTQAAGSTMTFKFNGTSVGVFVPPNSSQALFNQTLFSAVVQPGLHTLTVTNKAATFLDIDYVAFETSVGNYNESLISNTFQDDHPLFVYTPSASWTTPDIVGSFVGGSGHATTDQSAMLNLTFQVSSPFLPSRNVALIIYYIGRVQLASSFRIWIKTYIGTLLGDAIALYGPVGPNSTSAYAVSLDGGTPFFFSATKQFYRPQQILFFASNLGAGSHSLSMQLAASGGSLAVDFANVYTAPSLGGSFLGLPNLSPTPSTCPNTPGHAIPPGLLAALAITSTLAAAGVVGFIYFVWQHFRTGVDKKTRPTPEPSPMSVQPFPMTSGPLPRNQFVGAINSNADRKSRFATSLNTYTQASGTSVAGPSSSASQSTRQPEGSMRFLQNSSTGTASPIEMPIADAAGVIAPPEYQSVHWS